MAMSGRMAPLISAIFLAITLVLLVGDLEHPRRFYMILTRPQWQSWLVRGAVILTVFAIVLGIHLLWSPPWLAFIGIPIAAAAGTYTAFLFAQAKARDLWQSPLLPVRHLVQCIVAGSAVLRIMPLLTIATLIHLILILAEIATPHPTAHARLAVREMIRGKYRLAFVVGVLFQFAGLCGAPPTAAAVLILIGLFASEHAHVGAAQAVPLA